MQNAVERYPPTFGNGPGVLLDDGDDDGFGDDDCVGVGDGFVVFVGDGDGFGDVVDVGAGATFAGFGDVIGGVTTVVVWVESALMSVPA